MKVFDYSDNLTSQIVLCLGYFDGIHLGHSKLLERAKAIAKSSNCEVALFTFCDGFSEIVKGDKNIFTLLERELIFEKFEVQNVIVAPCDNDFLKLSSKEFLDAITKKYNIKCVVCGADYSFGHMGAGDTIFLSKYLKDINIPLEIVPFVYDGENKISSSLIKKHLEIGDMPYVSKLFGYDYFSVGEVIHGVNIGEKMGFPTLNTLFPETKKMLRRGVYKTTTDINGICYNSITNYGTAPTFDRYNFVIETHVLNFNKSIYGETVKVNFKQFMRGLIKFNSMDDLILQLKEDVKIYD